MQVFKNIKNFKALTAEPETKCDPPPKFRAPLSLGIPPAQGLLITEVPLNRGPGATALVVCP